MAQHDYVIDNGTGAEVRADINNVLQAIKTLNAGNTAPQDPVQGMFWLDTTDSDTYYLKIYINGLWKPLIKLMLPYKSFQLYNDGLNLSDALALKVDKITNTVNALLRGDGNKGLKNSTAILGDNGDLNLQNPIGYGLTLNSGYSITRQSEGLRFNSSNDFTFYRDSSIVSRLSSGGVFYPAGGIVLGNGTTYDYNHLLDDYEKGSYSATLYGADSGSITMQKAEYIKIGKLVHCNGRYWNADFSGLSGELRISLPFPIGSNDFVSGNILLDTASTSKKPLGIWGIAWYNYATIRCEQRIGCALQAGDLPDSGHIYYNITYYTY